MNEEALDEPHLPDAVSALMPDWAREQAERVSWGEIECCPRCLKIAGQGTRFDQRLTHLIGAHREKEF